MIHFFQQGKATGEADRNIVGGKGASLIAMCAANLPVPPGFTISIQDCQHYHANDRRWPAGLEDELRANIAKLEAATGQQFGEGRNPLLVSVRSGAARSMPGMMDTILNCGLHPALADVVPNQALFWTVYAQFARQFATTVAHVPAAAFDQLDDPDFSAERKARKFIELYEKHAGRPFPATPWEALRQCVNAVFDSWNNPRALIYRKSHGLTHLQGTAVTVQSMFNSEVSGIAFTANPSKPNAEEIIIEGSFGLGEAIVSGEVTPDRFVLDRTSLHPLETALGRKDHVTVTLADDAPPRDASAACLTDLQIAELARLALAVEKHFDYPVDIEWGLARGKFVLLQSRGIRGLDVARDTEIGRREEIERLKRLAAAENSKNGGKVWIVHNLAETLEAPTPLTWDIIRGFMSGNGGFGQMYQDLGYRPTRRVREEGFLELITGRIYADADRAAQLFWEGLPFKYDHEAILQDPRLLESAPSQFDATRADEKFLLRLPATMFGFWRSVRRMKHARANAIPYFNEQILPPYLAYIREQRQRDLTALSDEQLLAELHTRIDKVLTRFGNESLKPGFFGGVARAELEARLVQLMGHTEGPRLTQTLTSGLSGDSTVEQNTMLFQVAKGQAKLDDFIDQYGHRAVAEMELAKPRWREDAAYLHQIIASQKSPAAHSPGSLHHTNEERREAAMRDLPKTLADWGGSFLREKIEALAVEAQTLLPYREIGKHYLLMGYEIIRSAILEIARRHNLADDIFYLHLDELAQLTANIDHLKTRIAQRKIRWQSAQRLDHPDVIHSAELDSLGLPRKLAHASELTGLSLSAGIVQGIARIVRTPEEAKDLGNNCILICPSTDPSWTALFTTIRGLIVERGGVLSHGAITARDFAIPAVACPDATKMIKDGDIVRVNGDLGHIAILPPAAAPAQPQEALHA